MEKEAETTNNVALLKDQISETKMRFVWGWARTCKYKEHQKKWSRTMENNFTEQGDLLKAYCLFPSHNNGKLKSWSCLTAQPKTRKLRQVYWRLATDFLYRSWYQDAFTVHAFHVPAASYQHYNRLLTSWLSKLVNHRLVASFNKLPQVWKWQVATSLILTDLLGLDEIEKFVATNVNKF